jgi:hypothetical protein
MTPQQIDEALTDLASAQDLAAEPKAAAIRSRARLLCARARNEGLPVESLIVSVRSRIEDHPHLRTRPRHMREALRADLLGHVIAMYYSDAE